MGDIFEPREGEPLVLVSRFEPRGTEPLTLACRQIIADMRDGETWISYQEFVDRCEEITQVGWSLKTVQDCVLRVSKKMTEMKIGSVRAIRETGGFKYLDPQESYEYMRHRYRKTGRQMKWTVQQAKHVAVLDGLDAGRRAVAQELARIELRLREIQEVRDSKRRPRQIKG